MKLLKIFTVNARLDVDKGANDFELRKHRIAELINTEKPDIIGFQEATNRIRGELAKMLEGYYVLGCGRDKTYGGESTAIAYRIDKLDLIKLDTFWLSATPSIPGSRYGEDQSKCPRISTAALFVLKDSDKPFWFINTHLDHIGSVARLLGSTQLMQYISEKSEPCILVGDFNAEPDSKEIRALVANEHLGLVDCTANITETFHNYKKIDRMTKIDYIFTNMPCDASKSFAFPDDAPNGTFYSDHFPVCAFIEVE